MLRELLLRVHLQAVPQGVVLPLQGEGMLPLQQLPRLLMLTPLLQLSQPLLLQQIALPLLLPPLLLFAMQVLQVGPPVQLALPLLRLLPPAWVLWVLVPPGTWVFLAVGLAYHAGADAAARAGW